MNAEDIIKRSLAIVGTTQLLKTFIPLKSGRAWGLITIFVGVGMCLIPTTFLDPVIVISGATLFYDTIFQSFENLFKRFHNRGENE